MTVREWIGGTLWRAALLTSIVLAAGWLVPWPRATVAPPPPDVDRVLVFPRGQVGYEILDSAQVADIVAFLRRRQDVRWRLVPDDRAPFSGTSATLYQGEEEVWWMQWGPRGFLASDRRRYRSVRLDRAEAEELAVLMDPERYGSGPRVPWPRMPGRDTPAPSAR